MKPLPPPPPCKPIPLELNRAADGDDRIEVVRPGVHPEWDSLVADHPDATVFHASAWAGLLADTYGFAPIGLLARRRGVPVAALPLMEVGGRLRGLRGVSLPFTDACPPLLPRAVDAHGAEPNPPAEPGVSASLMEAAFQLAETRGWRSVEFRDATAWDPPSEAPSAIFYGHSIDLSEGDTTAVERCDPAVRRSIRKAERSGLRMVEASDERAIREYYRLHCQTRRRQGSPPQPFSFFARLHNRLLAAGLGCVLLAFKDQTAVAGAVFLFWGRNAMYKFGASDEAHQALRPNNLVFREALRVCVRRGCRQLDLGRTSVFNAGLRRFKLGWGSTEREIRYYRRRVPDRSVVPTPDHAAGWHSAVFRRMPISVARLMAKFAYRFAA